MNSAAQESVQAVQKSVQAVQEFVPATLGLTSSWAWVSSNAEGKS